jgi:hypothetical protein
MAKILGCYSNHAGMCSILESEKEQRGKEYGMFQSLEPNKIGTTHLFNQTTRWSILSRKQGQNHLVPYSIQTKHNQS